MLEPAEIYRGIEIRNIQLAVGSADHSTRHLRYYCVVHGLTLKDDESIDALKKKIDGALAEPRLPDEHQKQPQMLYRIVGIDANGTRTAVANGLTEPKALYLRAKLAADTKFPKLLVERETTP